jgi:hypothetical protein
MRTYLTEKKLVIALFIVVLITFSLAQEDSRKFDKPNTTSNVLRQTSPQPIVQKTNIPAAGNSLYIK